MKSRWKKIAAAAICAVMIAAAAGTGTAVAAGNPKNGQIAQTALEPAADIAAQPVGVNSVMSNTRPASADNKNVDGIVMSVDHYGVRYLQQIPIRGSDVTANTGKYAKYNVVKLNIGEQDFSNVDEMEIGIYSHHFMQANFWLVDSVGVTMRCNPTQDGVLTKVTDNRTGSPMGSNAGKDFAGVWLSIQNNKDGSNTIDQSVDATFTFNIKTVKSLNVVNPWTGEGDGCISTASNGSTFTWTSVQYVIALIPAERSSDTSSFGPSFFDITDISTVTGEDKTSVFDMQNCVPKSSLAEATKANDFAIGPGEYYTRSVEISGEVRKVTPGDFQAYRYGTGRDNPQDNDNVWTHLFMKDQDKDSSKTVDMSAYNALAFDIDTTEVTNSSGVHLDWKLRSGSTNFDRINGDDTKTNFYLVEEDGIREYYEDTNASWFKKGVKATVLVPLDRFDGVTAENMQTMSVRLNLIAYMNNEPFHLTNIRYIADYESLLEQYGLMDPSFGDAVNVFKDEFKAIEGPTLYNKDGKTGIRFGALAPIGAYNALMEQFEAHSVSYEFGTMIVPAELDREDIAPYADGILTVKCTAAGMKAGDVFMEYYGAIVDLKESNYSRTFLAYSYLKYTTQDGKTTVLYAVKNAGSPIGYEASLYSLAKAAVGRGSDDAALLGIVEKAEAAQGGQA